MKTKLFFILMVHVYVLHTQTTGYLGKKTILKTNLVNGRDLGFNNLDIERVCGRRTSIVANFHILNYGRNETGVKAKTGSIQPANGKTQFVQQSILKDGQTTGWRVSGGLKKYINRIISAPYGFYWEWQIGFGKVNLKNYNVDYTWRKHNSQRYNMVYVPYYPRKSATNLSGTSTVLFFEIPSFGYQKIFFRCMSIDMKIALEGQYCNLPDELVKAMEHNYYTRSNTVSFGLNKWNFGPSAYFKLGVLF